MVLRSKKSSQGLKIPVTERHRVIAQSKNCTSIQMGNLSRDLEVPGELITRKIPYCLLQEQQNCVWDSWEATRSCTNKFLMQNIKFAVYRIAGFLVTHTQSGEKFARLTLVLPQPIHKTQVFCAHQAGDNLCSCSSTQWHVGTLVFGPGLQ